MLVQKAEANAAAPAQHGKFFRQSGWLMCANIAGGFLMWAVHFLNKKLPPGEYGNFGVLLAVVMLLPTIPLQMVLAQQTAKALATDRRGELAGVIRLLWVGTTVLWMAGALVVLCFQNRILERWQMTSPVGLWITMVTVLLSLWMPMFWGVLQGQQNFLWLGWSGMASGIGRLAVAVVAVLVLHAYAAGMMVGVLLGIAAASFIAVWQTRSLWARPVEPFDWRGLLRQVVPLFLGFLGFQILFTADTIVVKSFFPKAQADFYVSAGTLSRALMWLVLPLAAVMFPRLVHSAVRAEKSNLLSLVLLGTAILAVGGALGLSLLGPWVVRFVYLPEYVQLASSVLPWYASAMVPLAMANVLLNNLLARPTSKWRLAFAVMVVAGGYVAALFHLHDSMLTVLKTMGVCNLVLLAVCAFFTWGKPGVGQGAGERTTTP